MRRRNGRETGTLLPAVLLGSLVVGAGLVLGAVAFALLSDDGGGPEAEVARVTPTAAASPAATATLRPTPSPAPPTPTPVPTPQATPQATEEPPLPTQEAPPAPTPQPPLPTEEPPPPTPEPTPAPTPTPSAPEIKTPLGTLMIKDVQSADRYPPDCDLEKPYSCWVQAWEGYEILIVWLEREDGGAPGEVSAEVGRPCSDKEVYVVAGDGSRIDCAVGGMDSLELFVTFPVPTSAHDFKFYWPGNPAIALED